MPWLSPPEEHDDLTYADAFLSPYNPVEDRLEEKVNAREWKKLEELRDKAFAEGERVLPLSGRRRLAKQKTALAALKEYRSYVLGLVEKYSIPMDVSRDDVDIRPIDGFGNIPLVLANMNAVVGKRMAETMSMLGGSAAIPQDKEDSEMEDIAEYMHSRNPNYLTPTTVEPSTRVHRLQEYLNKRDLGNAIVADAKGKFLGLVRFQRENEEVQAGPSTGIIPKNANRDHPVSKYMRADNCVTAKTGITPEDAYQLMEEKRTSFLPILGRGGRVDGVLTQKSLGWQWRYKPHVDEENGGLAMLATIGAVNNNPVDRAKFFIEDLGVKGIVMDTAHLDQGIQTFRNIEKVAAYIAKIRKNILLVAGNQVTPAAVRSTLAAGANIAKIGVGPGAMCTTRIETGNGRPQLSAVAECAQEAEKYGGHVWADGGVMYPRDVALALAAGASQVMIGSLYTPTVESPEDFKSDDHGEYKVNYGMASRRAATDRNMGKTRADLKGLFRRVMGQRAEGISDSRVYVRDGRRSAVDMTHWLMDGVTSAMTYAGAQNLDEFRRFGQIGIQTTSGYEEGKPKPVS